MPTTFVTPARPEPRHAKVPATGFHVESDGVAIRAPITLRQDEQEHHGCSNEPEHEKADEDDGEYYCVRHRASLLQPLLHLHPRLDESQVALDSLDHNFGALVDCAVVETARSENSMLPAGVQADATLAPRGN